MEKYLVLKTKQASQIRDLKTPKGETFIGQVLTKGTVLVYTPFRAPSVEQIDQYEIAGETISREDLQKIDAFQKEATRIVDGLTEILEAQVKIVDVMINKEATIVFFSDGDKVVVQLDGFDEHDLEKAISVACAKKMLGGYTGVLEAIEITRVVG